MSAKKNYDDIFKKFKELDEDIEDFRRTLGKGAFGEVREVIIGSKVYAAKLVEKEKSDNLDFPSYKEDKKYLVDNNYLEYY